MRHTCLRCNRSREWCECVDVCKRCMLPDSCCECGHTDVQDLYNQDDRFQLDEDVADDLRRDYQDEQPKSDVYWHGYNYARKVGKKQRIKCPKVYLEDEELKRQFYRGVSDARFRM